MIRVRRHLGRRCISFLFVECLSGPPIKVYCLGRSIMKFRFLQILTVWEL